MALMECNKDDDEIVINKRVSKQIVGNVKDERTGSMMPVVLEEMVDGTKSKKTGKKVSHKPSMAGDGTNMLDLSMENNTINEQKIAGVTKKNRTQRSQNKKRTTKVDSDLKIVGEVSGDSDGLKLKKDSKLPTLELELNLKTSVESSEDDLDSDLDRHRVLLVQNGSEKKQVETITNKLKKVNKNDKPHKKEVRGQKENDRPLAEKDLILQRVSQENQ